MSTRDTWHRIEDFIWMPGIFELARAATAFDLDIIVATNQAGIGRGFYTQQQFDILTGWMSRRFADEGAPLTAVYYCPFHADGRPPYDIADHPDRKPNPGMLLRAARDRTIDLGASYLIGDRPADLAAARNAGVGHAALLNTDGTAAGDDVLRNHKQSVAWLTTHVAAVLRQPGTAL